MKTMAMMLPTIVQGVRQNLLPWLAVKAVLTALVFGGQVGVWTAFVLDTAVSVLVLAYGWWLARRR
jgi:cation transport ATPase